MLEFHSYLNLKKIVTETGIYSSFFIFLCLFCVNSSIFNISLLIISSIIAVFYIFSLQIFDRKLADKKGNILISDTTFNKLKDWKNFELKSLIFQGLTFFSFYLLLPLSFFLGLRSIIISQDKNFFFFAILFLTIISGMVTLYTLMIIFSTGLDNIKKRLHQIKD
jgi:hypothetical protein